MPEGRLARTRAAYREPDLKAICTCDPKLPLGVFVLCSVHGLVQGTVADDWPTGY